MSSRDSKYYPLYGVGIGTAFLAACAFNNASAFFVGRVLLRRGTEIAVEPGKIENLFGFGLALGIILFFGGAIVVLTIIHRNNAARPRTARHLSIAYLVVALGLSFVTAQLMH